MKESSPRSTRRIVRSAALALGIAAAIAGCQSNDGARAGATVNTEPTPQVPSHPEKAPAPSLLDASQAETANADSKPTMILTRESLDVAGNTRTFVLAAPSTYSAAEKYPLVLVLHGDGGDGALARAGIPFDEISAQEAIVAYPSGTNLGWNLYDPPDTNADLAFLVALAASLETRFSVDPTRIFGMGFSSGAFMVNQVACRRPAFFRAIAPHSGGAPNEPRDPAATKWDNDYTRCADQTRGSGPAVFVIHGTADSEVSFASGDFTAGYWAYVDGCETTRSTPFAPAPCVAHDACPPGKPVVFCAVPDLGHTVWTNAGAAAWQFFRGL